MGLTEKPKQVLNFWEIWLLLVSSFSPLLRADSSLFLIKARLVPLCEFINSFFKLGLY
jgi:hypothetical protein